MRNWWRRPAKTQPEIAGQCEGLCRTGLLEVWVTRQGRLILVCDECATAWFDPQNISESTMTLPALSTWELEDGDVIDHVASTDEVEAGGWTPYVEAWARRHL